MPQISPVSWLSVYGDTFQGVYFIFIIIVVMVIGRGELVLGSYISGEMETLKAKACFNWLW